MGELCVAGLRNARHVAGGRDLTRAPRLRDGRRGRGKRAL